MISTSPATRLEPPSAPSRPARRSDIDWLRILAVLLLIPFHSARVFDFFDPFYIKNPETSTPLSILVAFVNVWHMPLFFLVAGAASWFALDFRSGGQYAIERFKRLLIPFIFGFIVIVPPQMWYAQRFHSNYQASFLEYYPSFFQPAPPGTDDYYGVGYSFGHLWFILFLFVFSLVGLPLFLYLKSKAVASVIAGIASFLSRPLPLFLLAIPLAAAFLGPEYMGHKAILYFIVVCLGFLLMSDGRYGESISRYKLQALAIALAGTVVFFTLAFALNLDPKDGSLKTILVMTLYGLCIWPFLLAILGYGRQWLSFSNRVLRYSSEAAYPFYILHQTVIVVVAYYVVQWSLGPEAKFLAIAVAGLALSLGIYDLVVRRLAPVRFLFGMRSAKR